MNEIYIGRLLRANTRTCVVGCQINQLPPPFGSLIGIPLDEELKAYALITDVHIDDDGLVRQLSVADNVAEEVIADNRINRNIPIELSAIFVGYTKEGNISHLLPPRPPLSLDKIFLCDGEETCRFTSDGQLGYLRHILGAENISIPDLLAVHLVQAGKAHQKIDGGSWLQSALQEVITLLRDDYKTLSAVLIAIADAFPEFSTNVV